jgi:ATP-dependent Clp protease ATP-binding subunit ClpC
MFERYSEDARRVIYFARSEALPSGSVYIEPEHLLMGLLHDARSRVNRIFNLTARGENFRKELRLPLREFKGPREVGDIPLSNASKHVLAYAADEADKLASRTIDTEHLLLGLLRETKSRVPESLASIGIDLQSARARIEPESGLSPLSSENARKSPLKPLAAAMLLVVVLVLIYWIIKLAVHKI